MGGLGNFGGGKVNTGAMEFLRAAGSNVAREDLGGCDPLSDRVCASAGNRSDTSRMNE